MAEASTTAPTATLDTIAQPQAGAPVATPAVAEGAALLYAPDAETARSASTTGEPTPPAVVEPKVEGPTVLATGSEGETKSEPVAEAPVLTAESYTITLPEGVVLDDTLMGEFKSLAATAKLDPASAQPLMDLYVKAMNQAQAQVAQEQGAWLAASNALPEFQGEMRKTSLATIGRAFDEYGTAEVQQVFAASGVGNHPAVVSMFLKMARALGEGAPVLAGTPAAQGRNGRPAAGATPGQIMYGDSPKSN